MNAMIRLFICETPVVRDNKIIVGKSAFPEKQDKKTWKEAS